MVEDFSCNSKGCPFEKVAPLEPNSPLVCAKARLVASLACFVPVLSKVSLGPGQVQGLEITAVFLVTQRQAKSKHASIPSG